MRNRFYLACTRDSVGSNMAFHGAKGSYPTDVAKAQVYTLEEAQQVWETARDIDQPISADHVDAMCLYKVDCQHIPSDPTWDDSDDYVAYRSGAWDGNDVYWYAKPSRTTDFEKALRLTKEEATALPEGLIAIPFSLANNAKRRTFEYRHFNPRTMVQGAGLKIPEHIKKERRRRPGLKTRMSCPSCGRFNWQYNPHDFERCSNYECENY